MEKWVALFPISSTTASWEDEPLDPSLLPMEVSAGITVEDASQIFKHDFDLLDAELGKRDRDAFRGLKWAIVHRFEADQSNLATAFDDSNHLIANVAACLRLIRPTRENTMKVRGKIRPGALIDWNYFETPIHILAVPEIQKSYFIRNRDLVQLKAVLPGFLQAMRGPFWKFRMAVEFHDAGHFQEWHWKAKYSLWCSALESIFTCESKGHRYSFVAIERIKWLIGENTPIYTPEDDAAVRLVGDVPIRIAVKDVLEKLYEVRNCIAHGRKIPDGFFNVTVRKYCGQNLCQVQVLLEALSVIIRISVLKILTDGLLPHFADQSCTVPTRCR